MKSRSLLGIALAIIIVVNGCDTDEDDGNLEADAGDGGQVCNPIKCHSHCAAHGQEGRCIGNQCECFGGPDGDVDSDGDADGDADSDTDTDVDSGLDSGKDADMDSGPSQDAGPDATPDADVDAGSDSGSFIVINDNGAWCWYQDPRAIIDYGKLIVGSVADLSGTDGNLRNGNVEVTMFDLETRTRVNRFVLHEKLEAKADDHDVPAFLVQPDGRYLAMYSRHSVDPYIRYRLSSVPGSTRYWGPEKTIEREKNVTYDNLFRLSAEDERIYNFYRGENYNPNLIVSDDNGLTWTYLGILVRFDDGRPYIKYASDGVDTIHFVTTEAHPNEYPTTSIFHGYLRGGVVYQSDGTPIQELSDGPVTPLQLTQIFAGDENNKAWTIDLELDDQGRPYTAFSVLKDKNKADHRYHYAWWDGAQWQDHEMAYAGTNLYSKEPSYTGLVALDPDRPFLTYISTNADPSSGDPIISQSDGKRHWELFKGVSEDQGVTWVWTPITQDSTVDNLRPIVPSWDGTRTALLWLRGTYATYKDYNLDVVLKIYNEAGE